MRSFNELLSSTQIQADGSIYPYYKKVDDNLIEETKAKIQKVLEEGLTNL